MTILVLSTNNLGRLEAAASLILSSIAGLSSGQLLRLEIPS